MCRLRARRRMVTPPKGNRRDDGGGDRSRYSVSGVGGARPAARGQGDDPQTWVGLFYRITGDPARALIFISVLLALVGGVAVVAFLAGAAWPWAMVLSAAGPPVLAAAYCVRRK